MKKLLYILVFNILFAQQVLVATSSNVSVVLNKLVTEFNKKYPNIKIVPIYSSSGKLTAQILHQSPYDIFLAANMKYPMMIYKKGLSITKPKVYAKGAIGLFSVKIKDLNRDNLKKISSIAIANPKFAPYGKAAIEYLKKSKLYPYVKNKIIYSETVSGVIPYTINAADVGIIAKSMIYSPKLKNIKFYYKDINKNLYTPINQGAILLTEKKEAKLFYNFLFTKKAKDIFRRYGYIE